MPVPIPPILKRLLGTHGLKETVGNATVLVLARFGGALANFLFTYLLARQLAPSQVGFVLTAMSLSVIASLVATVNIESGAVRHLLHPLEQGRKAEAAGFINFGRKIVFLSLQLSSLCFCCSC